MKFFDLDAYVAARVRLIEQTLRAALDSGETAWPAPLGRAMALATSGGKRIRAIVVLASAEAVGDTAPPPLGAASAVELVHCYSLVHDDLPAMDDAATRRGEPTVHRACGEAVAVLAGDALLSLAFEVLAREGLERDRARAYLDAVVELGRASGPRGMVGGQAIDMGQKTRPPATLRDLEVCHGAKTAALFSAAAAVGALAANASKEVTQSLRSYGFDLGLAFQHADDLADGDHVAFAANAKARVKELCARAIRAAEAFGDGGQPLRAIAQQVMNQVEHQATQ